MHYDISSGRLGKIRFRCHYDKVERQLLIQLQFVAFETIHISSYYRYLLFGLAEDICLSLNCAQLVNVRTRFGRGKGISDSAKGESEWQPGKSAAAINGSSHFKGNIYLNLLVFKETELVFQLE
jgi:hypothetical protein